MPSTLLRVCAACCAVPLLAFAGESAAPPEAAAPVEAPPAAAEAKPAEAPTAAAEPAAPKPPPYSLPWQLRPMAAARVVRVDDSLAFSTAGTTNVTFLNLAWAFHPKVYALLRAGAVAHAPLTGAAGNAFTNLLAGGMYLHSFGDLRLGAFLGVTAPVASGGGDAPDAGAKAANGAGLLARSAMDNAMFAVNDLSLIPGLGLSWTRAGLTVQLEATVLQLLRVRGALVQPDAAKTNFTSGLHLGYFLTPAFSLGAELRYQRWLTTPVAVAANEALRHNLSFAVGARVHHKVGGLMLRPGISYSQGLVGPMAAGRQQVVQFDLPVAF